VPALASVLTDASPAVWHCWRDGGECVAVLVVALSASVNAVTAAEVWHPGDRRWSGHG